MSNLMNYLPCLKCNSSSNILRIDYYNKEDCLYLKLACVRKCSQNYIKFPDLIECLNDQKKIPMSIFVYGNFSREQNKIETLSDKILNYYNKIYSDFEKIEKEIIDFKIYIKNQINKFKKIVESLKLINELIFGAYLKNIEDNLEEDNNSYLKNNLNFINVNKSNDFNMINNFYIKEIEKDIIKINNSFNFIKNEFSFFIQTNPFASNNLFPKVTIDITFSKKLKHNSIETYPTTIKDIKSIILLSDKNIALGSDSQLIIYNLTLNKEIDYIPGDFSDIREIKYSQKYKTNKDNIIILSILNKSIKIYNINEKKLLLNYVQNATIDNVLELYNGEILYITDFSIYNLGLNKEFKISLTHFCFAMINLIEKQNILGYTYQKYIKFIYLDNPKKVYKKIEVSEAEEIFDVKQIYNENKKNNFLIILSTHQLNLYNLNLDIFIFLGDLCKINLYKKINIDFNNENCFIIGNNKIKIFNFRNNLYKNIHNIGDLKSIKSSLYSKIVTTPFCFTEDDKYILIFESNDEGFNIL